MGYAASMSEKKDGILIVGQNKKARHLYELLEFVEAGLVLTGSEVKSLRAAKVSFKDGYVRFSNGEAWLVGVHINTYENAGYAGHEPERERKLLLHSQEIRNWAAKVEQKGLSAIPIKIYFKNGRAKIEIALGKGKKLYDQRETLKRRAEDRDAARAMAERG